MFRVPALLALVVGCAPTSEPEEPNQTNPTWTTSEPDSFDTIAPSTSEPDTSAPAIADCYADVDVSMDGQTVLTQLEIYDELERIVRMEEDSDLDKQTDYLRLWQYDPVSGDVALDEVDFDADGSVDWFTTTAYDDQDRVTEVVREDPSGDVGAYAMYYEYADDLLTRWQYDFDGDGQIDEITDYFYDADGRLQEALVDAGADGYPEERHTYTYPTPGRADYDLDIDFGLDGSIEDWVVGRYDEDDHMTSYQMSYTSIDYQASGTLAWDGDLMTETAVLVTYEGFSYEVSATYAYDEQERMVSRIEGMDMSGWQSETAYTWSWHCD